MSGHGRSTGGFGIDRDSSVMLIVSTALQHGVEDPKQIAYMLATAQHETRNFNAPEEDFGRSQARKLGYSGGEEFYGRGYVHLTHDYNYRKFDEILGMGGELTKDPDQAKDPELAAKILVIGMRDGLFTGRRLDRYINDETQDTYNARRVVNGITGKAWTIKAAEDCELYAATWEQSVPMLIERAKARMTEAQRDWQRDFQEMLDSFVPRTPAGPFALRDGLPDYLRIEAGPEKSPSSNEDLRQGARGEHVRELQESLDQLGIRDGQGRPLVADGVFGPATRHAVENFQLWNGLETSGVADRDTRDLLRDPGSRTVESRLDDAADPARIPPLAPHHPAHPDHAMYERIRSGVRAIEEGEGRSYDESSERVSRYLLARCKGAGGGQDPDAPAMTGTVLQRVDHVVMGTTGKLFAIEGRLEDPAQRRAWVSVTEAALAPVEASDRRLAAANANHSHERDIGHGHSVSLHPQF